MVYDTMNNYDDNDAEPSPLTINFVVGGDHQEEYSRHTFVRNLVSEYNTTGKDFTYNKDKGPTEEINFRSDVNVVFNPSEYKGGLGQLLIDIVENIDTTTVFIDVTKEFIESYMLYDPLMDAYMLKEEEDSVFYFLLEGVAGVFCDSIETQDLLFKKTGRMGTPVIEPEKRNTELLPPTVGTCPVWFGDLKDIFSIRKFLSEVPDLLLILPCPIPTGSMTEAERNRIKIAKNGKSLYSWLQMASFVYLPPTSTTDGEKRRLEKTEKALRLGKKVFTPDLKFNTRNFADTDPISLLEAVEYWDLLPRRERLLAIEEKQNVLREEQKDSQVYEEFVTTIFYAVSIEDEEHLIPLDELFFDEE